MHDKHEPSCSFCADFIFPFDADSRLADWGYCKAGVMGHGPTREQLREIEAQVEKGDYRFLNCSKILLYEAIGEGCERFRELGHHA